MDRWTRRDLLKTGVAASLGLTLRNALGSALPAVPSQTPDSVGAGPGPRERLLLDFGWRFHLGHANDPAQDFGYGEGTTFAKSGRLFSVSRSDFDDSGWRAVDLPHDWAVELPFQNDNRLKSIGFKPLGRDYPATSIGWYRRVFEIPSGDAGRRISLHFDGVYRDAMFVLNGELLGRNQSGYAPARYEVSDFINYGGKNVLVVRVDATEHEGWFYEGAGIYRHSWLVKTSPVHVAPWGTFVSSQISGESAIVSIATTLENESDRPASCRVLSSVIDAAGHLVGSSRSEATAIAKWNRAEVTQRITVRQPALWSPDSPHVYTAVTTIEADGAVVDRYETPFGIRTILFDADRGFFLNGRRVELKGTCNHQDHAGVGAALPDRLQYYRVERLKAMGSNAYRTSHNPPTPELLQACDRLGMLVLGETRMFSSSEEGLSQFERMLRRDRNHPCIFAWSIENEEPEQGSAEGERIGASMKLLARRLDPTRPITGAMNGGWGKGISAIVDVQGCNYHLPDLDAYHMAHPSQPMFGSETASTVSTRGIYENDTSRGYLSAYDRNAPRWASTAEAWWTLYDARPWLAGGFVWTGFDYRGEPTPYSWPCISSHFGIMDTCGFPKDIFYYYKAWWGDAPVLHLLPHWNWSGREGQEVEVWAFSNVDEVELFLNGHSLGTQKVARDSHVVWKVPYAPGTVDARGYKGGRELLTAKRETTGPAARIGLLPDRTRIAADGEDVVVVEVQVLDSDGRLVPTADNEVAFEVSGSGRLIGVGNGDPSSHDSDKASTRHAFNGLCAAIVQATKQQGEIRLAASASGLTGATIIVAAGTGARRLAVATNL